MKVMILQPLTTLVVSALMSAQAMAFGDRQRGIDWEGELNLTEQQEEQIEAIEDRYQGQFHSLRKSSSPRQQYRQQKVILMKKMRDEIQQVLTKEQRAIANNMMAQRRQTATENRLNKLARKLGMTQEQKSQLRQTLATEKERYQWPMDHQQREQARVKFNNAMNNILTREQQLEWQAMKAKYKKRWSHGQSDREQRKDHYQGNSRHGHNPGFRKGYNDW